MVRFVGTDDDRKFLLQRGDNWFWTGDGFSPYRDDAQEFADKREADLARHALKYDEYRGKPMRTFKLTVSLTVIGDAVKGLTVQELAAFLVKAMHVNIDTGSHGDGPGTTYVLPRFHAKTLTETPAPRPRY